MDFSKMNSLRAKRSGRHVGPTADRLLRFLSLFFHRLDGVTYEEIGDELKISKRTMFRYMKRLRAAKLDIQYQHESGRHRLQFITPAIFSILTTEEMAAIVFFANGNFHSTTGSFLARRLRSALRKLATSIEQSFKSDMNLLEREVDSLRNEAAKRAGMRSA